MMGSTLGRYWKILQEREVELNLFNPGLLKDIQKRILQSTRKRPNYPRWSSLWIEKLIPFGNRSLESVCIISAQSEEL